MPDRDHDEVASPRVRSFLDADIPRRMPLRDAIELIQWAFAPEPKASPPPPEHHGKRVLVLWRWARAILSARGLLAEDETIVDCVDREAVDYDPWLDPQTPRGARPPRGARTTRLAELAWEDTGFALLPDLAQSADERDRWCRAFRLVGEKMRVPEYEVAREGALGMYDPEVAHQHSVTSRQVYDLEFLLLDECRDLLLEHSEQQVMWHFRDTYGLSRGEAIKLIRLTRAVAAESIAASIDEDRALMVMRLNDLAARERQQMNTAGELRVLKELGRVQGLSRTMPVDEAREFRQAVREIGAAQDAKVLESGAPMPQLPAGSGTVEAEEVDWDDLDDDEREALENFDRENARRTPS